MTMRSSVWKPLASPWRWIWFVTLVVSLDRRRGGGGGGGCFFYYDESHCGRSSITHSSTVGAFSLPASPTRHHHDTVDVIICGGGPTGLLSAIMMSQKFPKFQIKLFDEQPHPPPSPTDDAVWSDPSSFHRHYLIGLGGRGITSLQQFGVWQDVERVAVAVPGRQDWNGNKASSQKPVLTFKTENKYTTQILPRDRLVSVLHHHIMVHCNQTVAAASEKNQQESTRYNYSNIEFHYGCKVELLEVDNTNPQQDQQQQHVLVNVTSRKQQPNTPSNSNRNFESSHILGASLVIAADGSARTFANQIQRLDNNNAEPQQQQPPPFRVIRYDDDNQRVYKNIAFQVPPDWRRDINYAVRTSRIIFDALPANTQGDYVGVLLLKKDDDMARSQVPPHEFRAFLQDQIPQFFDFWEDQNTYDTLAEVAQRPPSLLPMFRYVTPRMHHQNGQIVLLGDCAHTVKPYFGMGANSALEDVKQLSQCLDKYMVHVGDNIDDDDDEEDDDGTGKRTGADEENDIIMANIRLSVREFSERRSPDIQTLVQVSHSLDRPGWEGLFTFLIPIILDGIFSKIAPQWFAPNIISLLQNEEMTFQEAVDRKRKDRARQIVVLLGVTVFGIQTLVDALGSLEQ